VKIHAGVVGAGETPATQGAGRQVEVTTVFLDHDVGGDFGRTEERVLGLVDGEGLRNTVFVGGICVVPARRQLGEGDAVGGVAVDFVRAHVHERGFRAGLAGGFEEVERADGIGVEIVERNRRRAVMRWLRGNVDDCRRFDRFYECQNSGPVANINLDPAVEV
jgi:hypothetical protein